MRKIKLIKNYLTKFKTKPGPGGRAVLRLKSATARLLGLQVRFPPGAWMSLSLGSVACCRVEFSAESWSFVQKSPTDCGASLWVTQKTQEWECYGPRFLKLLSPLQSYMLYNNKYIYIYIYRYIDEEHCSVFSKYRVTIKEIDTFNVVLKQNY